MSVRQLQVKLVCSIWCYLIYWMSCNLGTGYSNKTKILYIFTTKILYIYKIFKNFSQLMLYNILNYVEYWWDISNLRHTGFHNPILTTFRNILCVFYINLWTNAFNKNMFMTSGYAKIHAHYSVICWQNMVSIFMYISINNCICNLNSIMLKVIENPFKCKWLGVTRGNIWFIQCKVLWN
jgi:hypothetical protein